MTTSNNDVLEVNINVEFGKPISYIKNRPDLITTKLDHICLLGITQFGRYRKFTNNTLLYPTDKVLESYDDIEYIRPCQLIVNKESKIIFITDMFGPGMVNLTMVFRNCNLLQ